MKMNWVLRLAPLLGVALLALAGLTTESGIASGAVSAQDSAQSVSLPTAELSTPVLVESPDVSICDSTATPDSASWIQLQKCRVTDAKKVIAWPLFSFPNGKDPQAMQFQKCLLDAQVSCGFDASPKNWWIGPVKQSDPDLLPDPANIQFSKSPLSQPELQSRKDQLNSLLFYLETQMAPVELAWRLGQSKQPRDPLFSLDQGEGQSQTTIYLGDCGSLTLGRVKIGGISVNLKSECDLHGAGAERIFRDVMTQSSHYFHWKLEEDDPKLMTPAEAGDAAEFALFPYTMAVLEGKFHRKAVPVPAESNTFLVSVRVPAVVVPPPPSDKLSLPVVVFLIILIGVNAGLMVLLFSKWRKAASPPPQPIHAPRGPGESTAVPQIEGTSSAVSPFANPPEETRDDTLVRIQSVIARLDGLEGSLRKLEDDIKRSAQNSDGAKKATAKAIDSRMKELEIKTTDLGGHVAGFTKRLDEMSTHVGSFDARLTKEIDSRIERATSEWSSMVLFDPASSPVLPVPRAAAAQRSVIEPEVEKILRPLHEFSNFALEILRAWLAVNPGPTGSMEKDELGKSLSADLKVLEAIVHLERPLWSWWLGKLPPSSAADIVVRVAASKWSSLPTTQQDAARLALQWADERVPRIQTLVEAAPRECGSHDPAGLRKSLIQAAGRLSGSTEDDDEIISLSKISTIFHALVQNIYSAAGAQYVAAHLYHDTIQSHDIPRFIEETHAAYAFAHSDLLVEKGIADTHGLVVRITQPLSKRRDRSSGKSKWEGSLYFLETRKPNA